MNNFYNKMPFEVFHFDKTGKIIDLNKKAGRNTSYGTNELLGKNITLLFTLESAAKLKDEINNLKPSEEKSLEYKYFTKTGEERFGQCRIVGLEDGTFFAFGNDTSDYHATKLREEKAQQQYKLLFDNLSSGCAVYKVINSGKTGKDYIIQAFNKKSLEIEQKTLEEVVGKSLYDLRPNIDDYGLINVFKEVWETGKTKYFPSKEYIDENYSNYYENWVIKLEDDIIFALYNDVTDLMQSKIQLENSKRDLEKYIQEAPYGVFLADSEGKYLEVNAEACRMTGFDHDELVGKRIGEIIDDETRQQTIDSFNRLKKEGQTTNLSGFIRKDGEKRKWLTKAIKLDETRYLGFTEDVTDKLKQEQKLERERSETKALFDCAGVGIGYYSIEGDVIWYNQIAAKNMGGKPEDYNDKSIFEIFPKEAANEYMRRITASAKSNSPQEYIDFLTLGGGDFWFTSTYNRITDDKKNILGIAIVSQNITEREQNRRELEKYYEMMEEKEAIAHIGSWEVNTQTGEMTLSNEMYRILGYEPRALKPSIEQMMHSLDNHDREKFIKIYEDAKKGIDSGRVEFRILRPDGTIRDVLLKGIIKEKGKLLRGYLLDVTRSKKDTEMIYEQLKFIEQAENIAKLGFYERNWQTGAGYWSKGFFSLLGLEPKEVPSHLDFIQYIVDEDRDRVEQHVRNCIKNKAYMDVEFRILRPDDTIVYIHGTGESFYNDDGSPISTIGVFQDITEAVRHEKEKEKIEESMRVSQRLESIGTLASGVAHEINNPINGILNYGQIIADTAPENSEIASYADEIINETYRVAEIVKNLLDFSRQTKQENRDSEIKDIISNTLSLLNSIFKRDHIRVNLDIDKNIPKIKCRSQQIRQVIMNVLTNARDSLNLKYPQINDNKQIDIRCAEIDINKQKWVLIEITDYGVGIPKEVKQRIFDPFFTTKDKDKGTGLGLSISYGIIKEHHGSIQVESEVNKYTKFIIELPCEND